MGDPLSASSSAPRSAGILASARVCELCGRFLDSLGHCTNYGKSGAFGRFRACLAAWIYVPGTEPKPEESRDGLISRLLVASRELADSRVMLAVERNGGLEQRCAECLFQPLPSGPRHTDSCRTGRVIRILDEICGTQVEPKPNREEVAQSEASPRVEAGESPRGDNRRQVEEPEADGTGFGEPWKPRIKQDEIVGVDSADGRPVVYMTAGMNLEEAGELSERIAACVNFCEGIATETLERQLPLASSKRMRFEEINHLRRALPWLPAVEL